MRTASRPDRACGAPRRQKQAIVGILLAGGEMHDDKSWFAPSHSRSLGAAAVPLTMYLNQLHRKLHPQFADGLLTAMDRLPKAHPLQEQSLATTVGLVVRGTDGHLVWRSVLRSSGFTAFDISALRAIDLAAPFDAAARHAVARRQRLHPVAAASRSEGLLDPARAPVLAQVARPSALGSSGMTAGSANDSGRDAARQPREVGSLRAARLVRRLAALDQRALTYRASFTCSGTSKWRR